MVKILLSNSRSLDFNKELPDLNEKDLKIMLKIDELEKRGYLKSISK